MNLDEFYGRRYCVHCLSDAVFGPSHPNSPLECWVQGGREWIATNYIPRRAA